MAFFLFCCVFFYACLLSIELWTNTTILELILRVRGLFFGLLGCLFRTFGVRFGYFWGPGDPWDPLGAPLGTKAEQKCEKVRSFPPPPFGDHFFATEMAKCSNGRVSKWQSVKWESVQMAELTVPPGPGQKCNEGGGPRPPPGHPSIRI